MRLVALPHIRIYYKDTMLNGALTHISRNEIGLSSQCAWKFKVIRSTAGVRCFTKSRTHTLHCSGSHDCCSHGPLLGASLAGTRLMNVESVILELGDRVLEHGMMVLVTRVIENQLEPS